MNWLTSHDLAIGDAHVTYAALITALVVVILGFFVAAKVAARVRLLGGAAAARLRSRSIAAQITGHVIRLAVLSIGLRIAGINVGSLLAAGAVLAVGIGIAMQKVVENFVSGVILFTERSIREGDIIEFDERIAKVKHIGIRATIALTLDDEEIIVPNSILTQSPVKNLTLTEWVHRLRVKIGIAYSADVDDAAAILLAAAEAVAWRDPTRPPIVLLLDFAASSIDFEVSVWTAEVWALRRGQSELRKTLWRALRDHGVAIPFPQLDVHFPSEVPPRSPPGADG